MADLLNWWITNWPDIREFFNSAFFSAIVGAGIASFAGAYGAQVIAERGKYREQLLKEIRETNAATTLAWGICNSLLQMKKQHIRSLKHDFDRQRLALLDFRDKRNAGQIPPHVQFEFQANLVTLSLPPLPIDILQRQIFEKLSLLGRALSLTTILGQTLYGLSASLEKRNGLIDGYKKGNPPLSAQLYFGLRQGDVLNEEYPASVDAISRQTDDGICFSHLLNKDLTEHGNELADRFEQRFGEGAPPISESDFGSAAQEGLMPDAKDYPDWFTKFKKKEPRSLWRHFIGSG